MSRTYLHSLTTALSMAVLMLTGCVKKCQTPAGPYTTIIDQEWRMVESNDPALRTTLTKVNFFIMVFKINFTGQIFRVENNDRIDDPQREFGFDVDVDSKLIKVQYYFPKTTDEQGKEVPGEKDGTPITYSYQLSRELRLTNTQTGYYYRLVPFMGVVKPDEKCEF